MYFPIGSVKCYNARTDSRGVLVALKFNRTKSLFIVLSGDSIFIWKTRVSIGLAVLCYEIWDEAIFL